MTIGWPNQVLATDTTHFPMRRGFVYLTVVLDRASRRVLAWWLSVSLAADAPVDAIKVAIARFGRRDNVFVERMGKSVRYEDVCLHGYETVSEARAKLPTYLALNNKRRPRSRLDRQTRDDVYFRSVPLQPAA